VDRLLAQPSDELSRLTDLLEVRGAPVASSNVALEPTAIGFGQSAFEVVGHELDELTAGEIVAMATS
jgi:hypothetical protein